MSWFADNAPKKKKKGAAFQTISATHRVQFSTCYRECNPLLTNRLASSIHDHYFLAIRDSI